MLTEPVRCQVLAAIATGPALSPEERVQKQLVPVLLGAMFLLLSLGECEGRHWVHGRGMQAGEQRNWMPPVRFRY